MVNLKTVIAVSLLVLTVSGASVRNAVWRDDLSLWNDIAQKCGNRARAHLNLCVSYSRIGDLSTALPYCNRAIAIDQNTVLTRDAYINRGAIFNDLGLYQLALQDYAAALERAPDDERIYNNIAFSYARMNNLDAALEYYSRAILLNPLNENALFGRADLFSHLQRYQLAIDDFTRVLTINPSSTIAHEKRGHAFAALGDRMHALYDLQRACTDGSKNACFELQTVGK